MLCILTFFCILSLVSPAYSNSIDDYLIEAEAYLVKGEFSRAFEIYLKIIETDPRNADAFSGIGVVYNNFREHEKALTHCQRAIQLNPHNAKFYFNLGMVYADTNRYDQAVQYFLRAIKLNPDYYEAYFNLGACYW